MKIMNALMSSALGVMFATAGAAQSVATINFDAPQDSGAIGVAKALYGQSVNMTTAVVDLNDDNAAEVAVRFDDLCENGLCYIAILGNDGSKWVELVADQTASLSVSGVVLNDYRQLSNGEGWNWNYSFGGYTPVPQVGVEFKSLGTPASSLTSFERENEFVAEYSEPEKQLLDINGDGSLESFVYSLGFDDCTGTNLCPVSIFAEDGANLGEFYTSEAAMLVADGVLYMPITDGFTIYSYDGQSLVQTASKLKAQGN